MFLFTSCGIGLRLYENDIYIYTVDYDSGDVYILGLTDLGKEQEYLIIPKEIEGKTVKGLGAGGYDEKKSRRNMEMQTTLDLTV